MLDYCTRCGEVLLLEADRDLVEPLTQGVYCWRCVMKKVQEEGEVEQQKQNKEEYERSSRLNNRAT